MRISRLHNSFIRCVAATLPVFGVAATSLGAFSYAFFFGMPAELVLRGDATFADQINLTSAGDQVGAMWHETKQKVDTGFITEFRFRCDAGPENIWGDGFAFVLQDSIDGTDALGDGGSGIGYAGIERSISVEFDTFTFGEPDEFNAPHVSIQSNGVDANGNTDSFSLGHVVLSDIGVDVLDFQDHTAAVQYTAPNIETSAPGLMQVYIDYQLVLEVNVDLRNVRSEGDNITDENGEMYVGLTAATGLSDTTHVFGAWSFQDNVTECLAPYWYVGGTSWGGPGSTFAMGVEFIGTLPISFQWFKDGNAITDDDGGRIQGLGTNQLRVENIQLPDAGHYWLVGSNACGEAMSFDFGLNVCTANFNCDNSIDFFDYLDYVDAFAAADSAADVNFDQVVDFFDYLDFVDAFSMGCV